MCWKRRPPLERGPPTTRRTRWQRGFASRRWAPGPGEGGTRRLPSMEAATVSPALPAPPVSVSPTRRSVSTWILSPLPASMWERWGWRLPAPQTVTSSGKWPEVSPGPGRESPPAPGSSNSRREIPSGLGRAWPVPEPRGPAPTPSPSPAFLLLLPNGEGPDSPPPSLLVLLPPVQRGALSRGDPSCPKGTPT